MPIWLDRSLDAALWIAILGIGLAVAICGWPQAASCDASVGSRLDALEKSRAIEAARSKIAEKSLHECWANAERRDEEAESVEKRLRALEKLVAETEAKLRQAPR